MKDTASPLPPLRVLETVNPPDGTVLYIDQVVRKAPDWVRFSFLSANNLASLRYDVLHVHWPDSLLRGRFRALRCLCLVGLLEILRWRRVAVVRTLHNLQPHEPGTWLEGVATRWLDRRTTYTVTINPVTPVPEGRGSYIPHGHYRDCFDGLPRRTAVAGRLLYAGMIRPYKGVDRLLDGFAALDDPALTLRLVGKPSAGMREVVEEAERRDSRISSVLAYVDDAQLVADVTAAELVCLPYRDLHNSGMLLLALSLERPVLVPRTPTTEALEREVGPGWIHYFDGAPTGADILGALARIRATPPARRPHFEGRDWESVGHAYARAFAEAARLAGRKPMPQLAPRCKEVGS